MYKMLVTSDINDRLALFNRLSDIVSVDVMPPNRNQVIEAIGEYDAYLTTLKFRTDRDFLNSAKRLKAIFTPSTGLDHIDIDYATEKGIAVFSMKNDREFLNNVTATAELAIGLLLGVIRHIPWGYQSVLNGIWARDQYRGHQLSGKTMGIVGYGRLGTIMGEYARALRMHVIACDRIAISDPVVEQVSFNEILRRSDVISIHIHLEDSNRNLFNAETFSQMKKGAILINTSRGGIIDELAMVDALERGNLGGAGVDVINGEWMKNINENQLVKYAASHDNLLISPHIGGITYESQHDAMENTIQKVYDYFKNNCKSDATENLIRSRAN